MDKNMNNKVNEQEEIDEIIDEEKLTKLLEKARKERHYDHMEVWKILGID